MANPEVTNPEVNNSEITCPACERYYVKPTIQTKCQHVLCKECWDTRVDKKQVTCPCCDVTADIRFLRMNFNMQKKVQEHLIEHRTKEINNAFAKVAQLQETGREWSNKWVGKTVEIRQIENETLEKITRSEKILIQLVREHHNELRKLVTKPVSATASEVAEEEHFLENILTELESSVKELQSIKSIVLSENENNKVSTETDTEIVQCLKLLEENEKQLELATVSDDLLKKVISFEWSSAPIETTKAFLDEHCQITATSVASILSEAVPSAPDFGHHFDLGSISRSLDTFQQQDITNFNRFPSNRERSQTRDRWNTLLGVDLLIEL